MKIIPPYQISSEILNLINQAEKYIVLVSPYVNFKNWGGIIQEIEKAKQRGVKIEFITRYDVDNFTSWEQIESLGIHPKLVKNLHAKLYYNEKNGIVTSMNLLTSSNLSAIEFGSVYDTKEEIQQLKYYVKQFLIPHLETELPSDEDLYLAKEKFIVALENSISNMTGRYARCKWDNGEISINANNQFTVSLDKVRKDLLISGIISGSESDDSDIFIQDFNQRFGGFETFIDRAKGSACAMMTISVKSFTSDNFNFLKVPEKKEIISVTCGFIDMLMNFKDESCKRRKEAATKKE
ncbi:MAG: phospholipase D-like domain-containing protein [Saprospiraceae bacterium]